MSHMSLVHRAQGAHCPVAQPSCKQEQFDVENKPPLWIIMYIVGCLLSSTLTMDQKADEPLLLLGLSTLSLLCCTGAQIPLPTEAAPAQWETKLQLELRVVRILFLNTCISCRVE